MKVDGITRPEDVRAAVDAGVNSVGFITGFPGTPRNLSIQRVIELLRAVPRGIETVVVTGRDPNLLLEVSDRVRPSAIQLYYDPIDDLDFGSVQLIRAIRLRPESIIEDARKASARYTRIVLDSYVEGAYGGTGRTHDWNLSAQIRELIRPAHLILAGGLTPENIAEAIRIVQPFGVDVSSGVETYPGLKDPEKMRIFVSKVRDMGTSIAVTGRG